jgi:anti-sigma-K factor RskA
MTNNLSIGGFAAAAAVSIALAGAVATAANQETKPVQIAQTSRQSGPIQIAQSDQQAERSRVYCYSGLKADRVDGWAPLYRGWVCIPNH